MSDLDDRLADLAGKLDAFARLVDLPAKQAETARIEARMADGDFWNDQVRAQATMAQLKSLTNILSPHAELSKGVADTKELAAMAETDGDRAEMMREVDRLAALYERLELALALGGKYDRSNVFLSIRPGAGGTESCDWAEMLFRMYSNYCSRAGYQVTLVDSLPGEVAGVKTVTLEISGTNAYGYLKSEMGTHRLVRISPFDSNARRQTSFAAVEVCPVLSDAEQIEVDEIDEKELRIDTYRAGGAGGQHVNKTDSAVRITHIPTGVVAACQTERSQQQNRSKAMQMLASRLQQLKDAERLDELKALQGERGTIGWGYQIRSYVMMPYQMVKDLRTGHETSQIQKVLDGELQPFIDAYLRWRLGGSKDRRVKAGDDDTA